MSLSDRWVLRNVACLAVTALLLGAPGATGEESEGSRLFDAGVTWDEFAAGVKAQRDLWSTTITTTRVAPDDVERFQRVSAGVRLLVVAEDWCPDSANVVPHVAELARSAGVPLRLVNRTIGKPLVALHPTPDGRPATPSVRYAPSSPS